MTAPGLVDALDGILGDRVVAARAALSPYSSSFRIEEVSVGLAGGGRRRLVLKDLSWHTMLDGARAIRRAAAHDPRREVAVYRHLLPRAPWGPPQFLGSFHDEQSGRHWLFLERVDGLQLRHVGDLDAWRRTARWAGELHARFSDEDEVAAVRELLPEWTAHRLRRSLRLAHRRVTHHGGRRARLAMAEVGRHHDTAVERLLAARPTLIHGQLYASNVLVGAGSTRRVCAVDWETAAVGPGVLDLAALVEGGWDDATRADLCRAYLVARDGAAATDQLEELVIDLACARLQLCLEVLALPECFDPPSDQAADWVERAADLTLRMPA